MLALGAAAYLFWFRDSSLVAVTDVEVVGVTSGEGKAIVGELTALGEEMTTLNLDTERIERTALAHPTVKAITIDPNFPHGLRLEITERRPAMLVKAGGEEVPAAADGTVLAGVPLPEDAEALPVLEADEAPGSDRLRGETLEKGLVLGAAPGPLRPLIDGIDLSKDLGIEVTVRGEIPVRFGTAEDAAAKWDAAAAVLADPKLEAVSYVDVRVPQRPAIGHSG